MRTLLESHNQNSSKAKPGQEFASSDLSRFNIAEYDPRLESGNYNSERSHVRTIPDRTYLSRLRDVSVLTREEEVTFFTELKDLKEKTLFCALGCQAFREALIDKLKKEKHSSPGRGVQHHDPKKVKTLISKSIRFLSSIPDCPSAELGMLKTQILELLLQMPGRRLDAINFLLRWTKALIPAAAVKELDLMTNCDNYVLARNNLMHKNLRLVISLAKRYVKSGLEIDDLISAGNFGLVRAIEKFNINRGVKFSTYAVHYIMRALTVAVRNDSRTIRVPSMNWDLNAKISAAHDELRQEQLSNPTTEQISSRTKLKVKKIKDVTGGFCKTSSIAIVTNASAENESVSCDDLRDKKLPDVLNVVQNRLVHDHIIAWLRLNSGSCSAFVIENYFGLNDKPPLTLKEIGTIIGVTKERVRQIKLDALDDLRKSLEFFGLAA